MLYYYNNRYPFAHNQKVNFNLVILNKMTKLKNYLMQLKNYTCVQYAHKYLDNHIIIPPMLTAGPHTAKHTTDKEKIITKTI